ncbi:DMT family transporter [Luteibacter flocculans]|uniref:DMT family transporter n=1 Tax=Luteibacter flocculans TaxID=2780091 RepID=A0ABY4T433_9GAMM|nr:DMT family transporter [Luteibacter flocculans]URL58657.1 DMT family transporter [Luteibacter flocculans]
MPYILLAVAFSVAVSVLLKLARRTNVDIVQAVATNYVVAAALAWWLLNATPQAAEAALQSDATRGPLLLLGVFLPAIFLVLASSVRSAGIVRTDVAQRLSLFLSLAAAFLFFGDTLVPLKAAGIALAVVALLCMLWRSERVQRAGWLAPLAVFAGFGAIDICFKLIAKAGASFGNALFASFLIAMVLCWIAVIVRAATRQAPLALRSLGFGVVLGAANFANILFYVRGHQALPNNPALVFASMNVGVVVLGALVGAIGFKERLTPVNWLGVALAIAAIMIMTNP